MTAGNEPINTDKIILYFELIIVTFIPNIDLFSDIFAGWLAAGVLAGTGGRSILNLPGYFVSVIPNILNAALLPNNFTFSDSSQYILASRLQIECRVFEQAAECFDAVLRF